MGADLSRVQRVNYLKIVIHGSFNRPKGTWRRGTPEIRRFHRDIALAQRALDDIGEVA
jgi:hypothetical protein